MAAVGFKQRGLVPSRLPMTNVCARTDLDGETLLVLPADFLSCDAEVLKQELISALVRAKPVELRGGDVTRAGTASLQLVLAFLREAERRRVPVRIGTASSSLLDALHTVGLSEVEEVARALVVPAS
jgi:STAS domain